MRSAEEWIDVSSVRDSSQDTEAHLLEAGSVHCQGCWYSSHTSSPVQNIGHLCHGVSLTSPSHVLR